MNEEKIRQVSSIPEELRRTGQFCLWKRETVDGRLTKVPYNPKKPQYKAATNRPETFSTFAEAVAAAQKTDCDGIGIRVTGDFIGIDIDHIENDTDQEGNLTGTPREIVDNLSAYTELSPSGHGLRIFCKAAGLKFDKSKYYIKKGNLEIYVPGYTNRFLTVTGNTILDEPLLIDCTDALQAVLDKYMIRTQSKSQNASERVSEPLTLSEEEILSKAINSKQGQKFADLYSGNYHSYYSSQSEADLALCTMLAFWCQKDVNAIDSLFRKSGLYREKWEREDYRESTLNRAISLTRDTYSPKKNKTAVPEPTEPSSQDEELSEVLNMTADSPSVSQIEAEQVPEPTDRDAPPQKEKQQTPPPEPPKPEPSSEEIFDEFKSEIRSERFKPIPTEIPQLDAALQGGLERRTLVTFAAAPGAGKTAIAQYILENMAWNGHNVVYVNLEMDRSQLLSRSISRLSHKFKLNGSLSEDITALKVKRGYEWTPGQRNVVEYVEKTYKQFILPNFRYVTTNPENLGSIDNTLSDILSKLEKITADLKEQGKEAPIVCIDYLQFIEYDLFEDGQRKPDNAEAIKQTLKMFKQFAMKHNTVVLMITANNRASNSEGKASMDSGRDTSNIEYSGDVMLSLVYTAVEEGWLHKSGKRDKNGNDIPKEIDNEFINYVIDYSMRVKEDKEYPMIAKLLSLKVVKGRSIKSRGVAKFIFDGRYFYYESDDNKYHNPYWSEAIEDPE